MFIQMFLLMESFGALGALEGPFICVSSKMNDKFIRIPKGEFHDQADNVKK
jgi:hypothetical protein